MIDYKSQDGTTFANPEPIGTGLFQVQERPFPERPMSPWYGPWQTVKRFQKLSEAEEWCHTTPTNWTERRIFVEPKEVQT